jgi:prepilin-type N-terminal cleavage/methylation domain-containing protein
MQSRKNKKAGFTLVEIMIVVAIIGLLAAIAIPNFVRARTTAQANACINNLRQIDSAKQQWALETRQATNATPVVSDIAPYLGRSGAVTVITTTLVCPAGGTTANFASSYTINSVSEAPTCQILTTTHLLQ